eukprot:CFRG3713T1
MPFVTEMGSAIEDEDCRPLLSERERQGTATLRRISGQRPRRTRAATDRWTRTINVATALNPKTRKRSTKSKLATQNQNEHALKSVIVRDATSTGSLREEVQDAFPKRRYSPLYRILCGRSKWWVARYFNLFIAGLIIANMIIFVLSSMESFAIKYGKPLIVFEGITSVIFLIEYILRVWTITESTSYHGLWPVYARLKYMVSFSALIDLFACLPFFIELVTPYDLPSLMYIRSLRLTRILKTERYTRAFSSVYRVVWYNSEILVLCLLLSLILLLFTSTLLYYLRPGSEASNALLSASTYVYSAFSANSEPYTPHIGNSSDVGDFRSIPATFYLSILMLTGQGQPEGYMPWYTKVTCALTAVFSVAIFAIPASMLTWGFEAEAERLMKRQRDDRAKRLARRKARRAVLEQAVAHGEESQDALVIFDNQSSSDETSTGDSSFDSELSATGEEDSDDSWTEYEKVALGEDDAECNALDDDRPLRTSPRSPLSTRKDKPIPRVGPDLVGIHCSPTLSQRTEHVCERVCVGEHERLERIETQLAILLKKVDDIGKMHSTV